MTTPTVLALGASVLSLWLAPGSEKSEPPSATLVLHWVDPGGLFTTGRRDLGKELSRSFAALGVSLRWLDGARPPGASTSGGAGIQILLVRSDPRAWRLPSNAMGAVLSRDGPQTEVYVFFDPVVRALGYRPEILKKRWLTAREKRELSRALARVVVHEVVHAVLPAEAHAEIGLTRRVLSRESLLDPSATVEPAVARAFRRALRRGSASSFLRRRFVRPGSP